MAVGRRRSQHADRGRPLSAYCLLPCLLPSASCLLPSAFCLLPPASCLLHSAPCLLRTAPCLLPSAYCHCLFPSPSVFLLRKGCVILMGSFYGRKTNTHRRNLP